MRLKQLIPRSIRKRLLSKCRSRAQTRRFERGLEKIAELKWQYDKWKSQWLTRHDPESQRKARELLQEMYGLLKRLARNNHKRELRAKAKELEIPGAHRFLK